MNNLIAIRRIRNRFELSFSYFELSRYPGNLDAFPKRVQARLDKDASLISGIRVPTLILWGEEDEYFPVGNAHRFAADIANSRVQVYPDVGHLPMEEVPEISVAHLIAFIRDNTDRSIGNNQP